MTDGMIVIISHSFISICNHLVRALDYSVSADAEIYIAS